MYQRKRNHILFCFLIIACIAHSKRDPYRQISIVVPYQHALQPECSDCVDRPIINVFIHGTNFLRSIIPQYFIKKEPALCLLVDFNEDLTLKRTLTQLSTLDPCMFPLQNFYVFSWSGKLNVRIREYAARVLCKQLYALIKHYIAQGQIPFLRVVAHSHGGNVALHLFDAAVACHEAFVVDELILLACPVQSRTMDNIDTALFQRVYAFYSSLDIVQCMAPQFLKGFWIDEQGNKKRWFNVPPFSDKRFPERNSMFQAKVKLHRRAMFHKEFISPKFISFLPTLVRVLPDVMNTSNYQRYKSCCMQLVSSAKFDTSYSIKS